MDVMLHISTPDAARIATGLARALNAQAVSWGCFLTNDGVKLLGNSDFAEIGKGAVRIAVCEHSCDLHMAGRDCPAERGSQTVNSLMMGESARIVSL